MRKRRWRRFKAFARRWSKLTTYSASTRPSWTSSAAKESATKVNSPIWRKVPPIQNWRHLNSRFLFFLLFSIFFFFHFNIIIIIVYNIVRPATQHTRSHSRSAHRERERVREPFAVPLSCQSSPEKKITNDRVSLSLLFRAYYESNRMKSTRLSTLFFHTNM